MPYVELTLEETMLSSYSMGGASAAPLTGEAGLANFSIEQPVERADDSPTTDDLPTEAVSFAFGQVKVPYLGNSTSSADGGGGQGAGKVAVADFHVPMEDGSVSYTGLEGDTAGIARVTDADTGEHAAQNNLKQMTLATINVADRPVDPAPLGESRYTYAFEGNISGATLGDGSIHLLSQGVSDPAWSGAGFDVLIANTGYDRDGIDASAPPTGHYTQMVWAETRSSDVQPNPPSWGIDRVDQRASFMGGVSVEASDAAPGGRLFLATEVGVYAGGGLNDWRSNYGTGGGAAASDGGGDDILIGGDSANGGLSHGKASFQDLSVIIPASEGGLGVNTVLLDGSIRTVGPQDAGETSAPEASGPMKESMETMKKAWKDASATPEASPVTEHTSGLTYSGESGGLNEAQTVPTRPMSWDNVANKPAVEPYGHVDASGAIWGLDRIDMLDDAATPFFAYDVGFRGGVDVSGSHHTGALRNVSGDAMPAAAGDNMQTYLELELTDALLSSYASGRASEDDFAAVPADTGNHLGNTYTGMTVINDGVLQQDMTLSFSYSLV